MKRAGHLMERIAHPDNLSEAFLRAARGKWHSHEVQRFAACVTDELKRMADELLGGSYRFGQYHLFTVYDPKKRTICAAPFRDRVAMHAIMRICHPVFDDFQTNDSFASRKGRGQYAALERTQGYARRFPWFAKMDMRKYFDSIDHKVMMAQLARLFKDRQLLLYFCDIMDGYETTAGKGLPIGVE